MIYSFLCPPPCTFCPCVHWAQGTQKNCSETDGCSVAHIIKHQSTRNNTQCCVLCDAGCCYVHVDIHFYTPCCILYVRSLLSMACCPGQYACKNVGQLDWLQGVGVRLHWDQLFHRCRTIKPKDYFGDCVNLSVFLRHSPFCRSYHISLSGD